MKTTLILVCIVFGLAYWASVHTHQSMLDTSPSDVSQTISDSVKVSDGAVTFKPAR